jgi:hypothetical protein
MTEISINAQIDVDEIAQEVAPYISPSVIANEIDLQDLAGCLDVDDIAQYIDQYALAESVAYSLDVDDIAERLDYRELAKNLDINRLSATILAAEEDGIASSTQDMQPFLARIAQLDADVANLKNSMSLMMNALHTASDLLGFNRTAPSVISSLHSTEPF